MSGSCRPARSSAAMRGANSRAQNSRTAATSCSWSPVRARASTGLRDFVGLGVGQALTGGGLYFAGRGVGFGDGEGQATGLVLRQGLWSVGPAARVTGRGVPKLE